MPHSVKEELASLRQLDRAALLRRWRELFGETPPARSRRTFIIPALAYRIQERALGSLRPEMQRRLRQLAKTFEEDPKARIPGLREIKAGTRLVRKWRDEIHVVNVLDHGFEYRNARYKSLSQIARQITETRWSGPLFFGLKDEKPNRPKEAE